MQPAPTENARTWFLAGARPPVSQGGTRTEGIDARLPHEKSAAELWRDVEHILELGWHQSAEVQIDNALARGPATQEQLQKYVVCAQGNVSGAEEKMRKCAAVVASVGSTPHAKENARGWIRFYLEYIRTDVVRPLSKARRAGYTGPIAEAISNAARVIAWGEVVVGDAKEEDANARIQTITAEICGDVEPNPKTPRRHGSGTKCEKNSTEMWADVERLIELGWYQSAEIQAEDALLRGPATQQQLALYVTCAQGNLNAADSAMKQYRLALETGTGGAEADNEARRWIGFHAGHIRTDVVRPLAKALQAGYRGRIQNVIEHAGQVIASAEILLDITKSKNKNHRAKDIEAELLGAISTQQAARQKTKTN